MQENMCESRARNLAHYFPAYLYIRIVPPAVEILTNDNNENEKLSPTTPPVTADQLHLEWFIRDTLYETTSLFCEILLTVT